MHSYMENFPKKAQLIADIRTKNVQKGSPTFIFDSGDLFSDNIFFNMYRGVNGRAVEPDKVYQIVTNSFVWSGKDNYDDFYKVDIISIRL